MTISGHLVDIFHRRVFPADIQLEAGRILSIHERSSAPQRFILPGFIDAHVHIESSMLIPSEFARMAVVHGTVATVSDPHEIGNVMGIEGVRYMVDNGAKTPFKFYFGVPSCVPATTFETAGAEISIKEIDSLFRVDKLQYLAEMMNWPGVLSNDPLVKEKIAIAHRYGKPVDGHAPGLRNENAAKYASAGITTDHECFSKGEALDKLACGMKIIIREGSAARNFDSLVDLMNDHYDMMMFCSDDKHPDSLEMGHINMLVKRAYAKGIDVFKILKVACVNPALHYKLDVGLLRTNDPADFIIVDNLSDFNVLETWIGGSLVAQNGRSYVQSVQPPIINNFNAKPVTSTDFQVKAQLGKNQIKVIEAFDGQLITNSVIESALIIGGFIVSDTSRDVLKIAVINRYSQAPPAIAFIRNFGLRSGAIASSVAHDSHNIIVVGADDDSMTAAANLIINEKGGISLSGPTQLILPLPVAGIMSTKDGYEVSRLYQTLDNAAKQLGSELEAPFMTLSFMALLVIPSLKLSDRGLFNGERFEFTDVQL
jgi:adenine deaminase